MTNPTKYTLAVLGGSGLYELDGLTDVSAVTVETPFGAPSDVMMKGRLGDTTLLFLPRHGRGHRVPPHEINPGSPTERVTKRPRRNQCLRGTSPRAMAR